ncbi:hypothetical protein ACJ7K1_19930 [Paenibacillus elgii]|nr:hypothetical protein [Paenibacillus tyrfis]
MKDYRFFQHFDRPIILFCEVHFNRTPLAVRPALFEGAEAP